MNRQPLTVAVVGATGVVGRTMIQILNEREFPVGELRLLASGRSAGRTVSIDGRTLEIGEAVPDAFEGVDIALFSAGADISHELAPAAVAHGATVIDNSSAWRMDTTIPLVVSQVNPDDLEGHPGIIANPNCSTMQLAPVLMALRDTVGLERVVVDTYQSVSGTGRRRPGRARGPDPGARRRRGADRERLPAPDRVQRAPRDRRLPPERLHQGGVEARQREPQDPAPAGPAHLVHGRPHPGLRQPLRGRPRRDARADHARSGTRAVRGSPGRRRPGRPGRASLPAGDRGGRARRDLRRARASRRVDRGRSRSRLLGRVGQPAQGRRDQRRRAGRDPPRARLDPPRRGPRRQPVCRTWSPRGHGVTEAERRVSARGHRGGGPGLHELPAARDADARGARARATPRPRSCSSARARASTRTARAGRSSVGAGDLLIKLLGAHRLASRGRVHHERREVPAARQPRPAARRDRGLLRPTCVASSRSSIRPSSSPSGATRWRRFMPGRAHLAGARDRPCRSIRRLGRREALAFAMYHPAAALSNACHRTRELRRHRHASRLPCSNRRDAPRVRPCDSRFPKPTGSRHPEPNPSGPTADDPAPQLTLF